MKEYNVRAWYTISVNMTIEADSYDEAMEIAAYDCDYVIDTEWNGNSVFIRNYPNQVVEMTLEATGMLRDFECDDEDEDEEEE